MVTAADAGNDVRTPAISLARLFLTFLRFGCLAFGGPVAQIAMIKRELVETTPWISPARFNRLLAVMQALPGPEAHELCVHLGMRARGRVGGILAGLGFMLPGFLLMLALSWLYFRLDPDSRGIGAALLGVQAGVTGLILLAVPRIGRHALSNRWLWGIALLAGAATVAGTSFWLVLPAGGCVYALAARGGQRSALIAATLFIATAVLLALIIPTSRPPEFSVQAVAQPGDVGWPWLLLAGLKAGLLTFGGAYTAIPVLRGDAVGRGWMGDGQFLDGLALSGVLPAPLIIFSTFVGYVAGGPAGALAITIGVFLPAFAFSLIFYDRLEAIVGNPRLHALLEGIMAAVVGLIGATALQLATGLLAASPDRLALGAILGAAVIAIAVLKGRLVTPLVLLAAAGAGALLLP